MKDYKRKQIIKHALQFYINRAESIPEDIKQEVKVLNDIEWEIILMKDEYGIELTEGEQIRYEKGG